MIRNSIKQLFRTPLRTVLYFFLIAIVGALLSIGLNLWMVNEKKMKEYEKNFITIGMVEQECSSIKREKEWDAQLKDYKIYQRKTYDRVIPVSELLFKGANYSIEPEFRPYYCSYAREYIRNREAWSSTSTVVEFTPMEEGNTDKPTKIKITKVLENTTCGLKEGNVDWFCDHYTKDPKPLKMGKTYVADLYVCGYIHDRIDADANDLEYTPAAIESSQATITGELMDGPVSSKNVATDQPKYYEVNEGFYDSEIGQRYLEQAKGKNMFSNSIPVTGTKATKLLMPFYNQDAYITEGRDITVTEYGAGDKVCIIPEKMAKENNLKIGDYVNLRLFQVIFGLTAMNGAGSSDFINANGKAYDIFEESQYKIVGIYKSDTESSYGNDYSLADYEIIIPSDSVKNPIDNNISTYRPMSAGTTSFQIPNGEINSFMEKFNKTGLEDISIVFYDMGYTQLEAGLQQMKYLSIIFLISGSVMMVFILLLFTHIYITNDKRRTMLERTLGISKIRCMASVLAGVMIILLAGSMAGGIAGSIISEKIVDQNTSKTYYNLEYSSNIMALSKDEITKVGSKFNEKPTVSYTIISTGVLILFGSSLALGKAIGNIRQEPLKLLGERLE